MVLMEIRFEDETEVVHDRVQWWIPVLVVLTVGFCYHKVIKMGWVLEDESQLLRDPVQWLFIILYSSILLH
jgi:hypothetical protein